MTKRNFPRCAGLLLIAAFLVAPGAVRGDATVERFNKSGGIKGIGASESSVVEKLSRMKKHETSSFKMTGSVGGFFSKFAGDMGSDVITDIDKDVVWTLDHKKKAYTERPITLPKEKEEPSKKADKGKEEKPKVRIVRNEISVKATGEKKTINGFDCTRYIVTWLIETENIETRERSKTTMTNDLWNTPETKQIQALQKEELEFAKAYMKKMGISVSPDEARKFGMTAVAGMFGEDEQAVRKKLKELQEKLEKIKGYPIVTALQWEIESPEASRQAGGEKAGKDSEDVELSGGIGGFLGGLAKKAAMKKASEGAEEGRKGGTVLFDFYSEVKKIDVSSIPSSDFTVPSGYKLVK
ncbi:MAG: hypothetical protein FIA93_07920 [Deltaproteobacteria bacterium]|nr:hypothetical protein [Deltaproteobacteria bacterium]